MKKNSPDDWGTPLGGDTDQSQETPREKKTRRNSATSLVYYFSTAMPMEAMNRIGSPVNGPALMKGFKKLLEKDFTHDEIRGMIDTFASRLRTKPLKPEVLPWRAFLADLDKLAEGQRNINPNESYGSWGIDTRLEETDDAK